MEPVPSDGFDFLVEGGAELPALGQRHTPIRIAGALLTAVLAIFMVLAFSPSLRGQAIGVIFGPVPSATPAIFNGTDNLYVLANVPWGTVTLDDKLIAHLPVPKHDPPLRLARGVHTFTWQAAPFAPQSCIYSVPGRDSDTCQLIDLAGGQ